MNTSHVTTPATPAASNGWTELASRDSNGLAVSLLWSKATGRVKVTVVDDRLGEEFDFKVAAADALAAFYHPFAYMASSGQSSGASVGALDLHSQS